ncbi:MAG TPA: endonuclease III domain-containing protein [Candidatus Omnitrophota bacterium]|nr:endonuclease III domain-containing protein [Candidatus Omnitrophota bacterium]
MKNRLSLIYKKLYSYFGPQAWWPAQTPFEVMVGAILTQNTNWSNVEKAIANLKKQRLLSRDKLSSLPQKKLAQLIRPAGYFNIKAKRLKNFLRSLQANHRNIPLTKTSQLRNWLLSINGIGPETADSILLYALARPVFVVDSYTKRILSRHSLIDEPATYEDTQRLFMQNLKKNTRVFNEYHALLVRLAKDFCLKHKPRCPICPLYDGKTRQP